MNSKFLSKIEYPRDNVKKGGVRSEGGRPVLDTIFFTTLQKPLELTKKTEVRKTS